MRKKLIICESIKALICFALVPLLFIKVFHDVGMLQGSNGEVYKVDYYYSAFTNLTEMNLSAFIPIAFLAVSIIVSVVTIFKNDNKKLFLASNITFAIAIIVFISMFSAASTISRGY